MTRLRPIPDASLGQPTPADTDAIFRSLMEEDFSTALSSVWSRLQDRVALQGVLPRPFLDRSWNLPAGPRRRAAGRADGAAPPRPRPRGQAPAQGVARRLARRRRGAALGRHVGEAAARRLGRPLPARAPSPRRRGLVACLPPAPPWFPRPAVDPGGCHMDMARRAPTRSRWRGWCRRDYFRSLWTVHHKVALARPASSSKGPQAHIRLRLFFWL